MTAAPSNTVIGLTGRHGLAAQGLPSGLLLAASGVSAFCNNLFSDKDNNKD